MKRTTKKRAIPCRRGRPRSLTKTDFVPCVVIARLRGGREVAIAVGISTLMGRAIADGFNGVHGPSGISARVIPIHGVTKWRQQRKAKIA